MNRIHGVPGISASPAGGWAGRTAVRLGGCGCRTLWSVVAAVWLGAGATVQAAPAAGMMSGNLWQAFQRGGPVMWPILLLSVFGLALIFEFLFTTRKAVILPAAAEKALESPDCSASIATRSSLPPAAPKATTLRSRELPCVTRRPPAAIW